MLLFKTAQKGKLQEIRERPFKKEKDIQTLCEGSLQEVFGLEFVRSEFSVGNFRIDTLAFDTQSRSFVIIEYKRDKNFSVIDQGYAYLSLMLNNKADFILEYNESRDDSLKRTDVDWSQSRVVFLAPAFTAYQRESINFKDLPIELVEVHAYTNDTVCFVPVTPSGSIESIHTVSGKSETIEKVSKEVKVYTEDDHLSKAPDDIKDLYDKLKQAILNISDYISIRPTKIYIGFVANKRNICDVTVMKSFLKVWPNLSKGELDDPKGLARDVSSIGHWGNGDYEVHMRDDDELEYTVSLVRQAYKRVAI